MRRFLSVLIIAIIVFSFSACKRSNDISFDDLKDISKTLEEEFGYDNMLFKEDDVDDELYYTYGVESTDDITDYLLCLPSEDAPDTVACIIFKNEGSIDDVRKEINDYHVLGQYPKYQLYDPEGFEILKNATFKKYSNALLLVIDQKEDISKIIRLFDNKSE